MSKSEAKKLIEAAIKENKVAVFSKAYCPYCTMAKEALDQVCGKGGYFLLEIENLPNCNALQDVLKEMTGARSVRYCLMFKGSFWGRGVIIYVYRYNFHMEITKDYVKFCE